MSFIKNSIFGTFRDPWTRLNMCLFVENIIPTEGGWSDGDVVLGPAKTSRGQQDQGR